MSSPEFASFDPEAQRSQRINDVAKAFNIPDESRDNPLIQAFLERRARTSEQPIFQAYTPTTAETIAARYDIPEDTQEHPVIQEFTRIAATLDSLVDQTLNAATAHLRPTKGNTLARERELLGAPDMTRTLSDRYEVANALLVAANTFLTAGLGEDSSNSEPYGFRKLKEAASRLGYDLTLTKQEPTVYNFDSFQEPDESDE
jgi:hypothetical protein